ncbi:MAG: rod-binding protein [Pseudomonadota bacterium]
MEINAQPTATTDARRAALKDVAVKLEATFLEEMLKHTGIGETSEAFGGGPGEEAFAPLITREYATLMAERGGIGLAEHLFRALVVRDDP